MAQTGYTPISLYYTTTASAVPTTGNLVAGELAINTADGKLFYKDSSGVVQTIASKAGNINVSSFSGGTTGLTPNTATTGAVTLAGTLAVANGGTGSTTSTGSGSVVLQTSPSITTPTIDKINTSVANTSLGAGNASIMKNRIINGAMVIDQRNAGASVSANDGKYLLDRFKFNMQNDGLGTGQQVTTAPVGFNNSLKFTSTAATTVGAGDTYGIIQNIEGYNIADLGWGTASAKTVTLSTWVYSSLTGTFGGIIKNNPATRNYAFTYSIPVANTWTQISVTIAGDTSGTWLTTNGVGMQVVFNLASGSSVSISAGSWQAGNNWSATGAVQVLATNGATFYITGVQLEVGTSATGFEYRQYGQELALCQRYYYQINNFSWINVTTNFYNGTYVAWKVSMRASPTVTSFSTTTGASGTIRYQDGAADVNAYIPNPSVDGTSLAASNISTNVGSNMFAKITASAEL